MLSSRRERDWWDGGGRFRLRWRGLARLRTAVLVVAAMLSGAALSAAVLVGFWNRDVSGRHAAEEKLAASRADARALAAEITSLRAANTGLQTRLHDSRAVSARLEQGSARLRTAAQALLRENTALVASAGRLQDRGGSLQHRAVSVSKLAAALGNDLVSVLAYITSTSVGSLDPSYLKAQLDYLQPAVTSVRSAAETLGADAGGYATAVERFTAQAAAYAAALRRLADKQASAR